MMQLVSIVRTVNRLSRSAWWYGLITALTFVSFAVLQGIDRQFLRLTGAPVFDTQNNLTPALLRAQLPHYQGEARALYAYFAVIDMIFPLVAALFLALTWCWLLRQIGHPDLSGRWVNRLPLVAFVPTLFDYLENLTFISIVFFGVAADGVLEAAILFKKLKLASLGLCAAITLVLGLWLLVTLARRRLSRV
jgi:hypothetical protein